MMPHYGTTNTLNNRTGRLLAALLLAGLAAALLSAGLAADQAVERKPRVTSPSRGAGPFRLEEATIADLHRAIQQGETTCKAIVQAYIERARAHNGTCTELVTRDGASTPAVAGAVRAGSAAAFPSSTTAVRSVLPGFDEYMGPPIDFGATLRPRRGRFRPAVRAYATVFGGSPTRSSVRPRSMPSTAGTRI